MAARASNCKLGADTSTSLSSLVNTSTAGIRTNVEDSGNLGDNETSRDIVAGSQMDDGPTRVFMTCSGRDVDDHLDKLLECPVCYDVILPPIICCVAGHSCCEGCRQSLQKCPVCRGNFTNVRNLFAEHFLEKCLVKCKNKVFGCPSVLSARELAIHYQNQCEYRPIHCRECDVFVLFEEYLEHIQTKDKIERQKASECSTGFEIDDTDLYNGQERQAVWEPTWMYCYGHNFFCSLEHNGEFWWIWVSSLSNEGCKYKGQVILWNKEQGREISYTGKIHSVRCKPEDIMKTGECLILKDKVLRDFMYQGGIDVLVRIERVYNAPKTRRGLEVESPLAVVNRDRLKTLTPVPASELPSFATPSRTLRSTAVRDQSGNVTTRIPTGPRRHAVTPTYTGAEERRPSIRNSGGTHRILFDSIQSSSVPVPPRSRNSRQAVSRRRIPAPQQPEIEVINVDSEE